VSDPRDQRIADLESRVAAQDTLLAAKDAEIADLKRKVEDLTQMVLMLKERLDRNSGNSGKPPSSDSPSQRFERQGKGATGCKRGGQLGHKGWKRALVPPEQVTETKRTRSATTVGFGICSVVAAGRPSSVERRSAQGSATEVVRLEQGHHVGSL
jgi:uncharacterized coiled-coil protein SlyX